MFAVDSHFYFGTHKKLIIAFADIFNEMRIKRVDEAKTTVKEIKVPISFSPRSKFVSRLAEDYAKGSVNVETSLPRLSFEFESPVLDTTRMKSKMSRCKTADTLGNIRQLLNPAPYDFPVTLRLWSKNLDDAYQIVEQILATFLPDLNTNIIDIPEINLVTSVPVILDSNAKQDDYEGDFTDFRAIEWEFNFTMKAYIYKGLLNSTLPIIKQVNALIYDINAGDKLLSDIENVLNPIDETLWDDPLEPTNVETITTITNY